MGWQLSSRQLRVNSHCKQLWVNIQARVNRWQISSCVSTYEQLWFNQCAAVSQPMSSCESTYGQLWVNLWSVLFSKRLQMLETAGFPFCFLQGYCTMQKLQLEPGKKPAGCFCIDSANPPQDYTLNMKSTVFRNSTPSCACQDIICPSQTLSCAWKGIQ